MTVRMTQMMRWDQRRAGAQADAANAFAVLENWL
jgi:hypothetical protein